MTRLTKQAREDITQALLEGALEELRTELRITKGLVGAAVYLELYDEATVTAMKSLPAGFFESSNSVRVSNFGYDNFTIKGIEPTAPTKAYLLAACHSSWFQLPEDSPAAELISLYHRVKLRLSKKHDELRSAVREALERVTTVAALIKSWPECEPFIPEHYKNKQTTALTVVNVANLNAALGLEKKGE